jgi:hypothetical protein
MDRILPLLKEDIAIAPQNFGRICQNNNSPISRMLELLAPPKTKELDLWGESPADVENFNHLFPNFVDGIQSMRLYQTLSTPDRDNFDLDFILKWLTASTPRKDGKPKVLHINFDTTAMYLIDRIKEVSSNGVFAEQMQDYSDPFN